MPGYRTIISFGGTLPYRDRVEDLSARLSVRGRSLSAAHNSSAAKMRVQLFFQYSARLNEEAFIDCFMGDLHCLIVEIFGHEPSRYLLSRPMILQLSGHHSLKRHVCRKTAWLWTRRFSQCSPFCIGRTIFLPPPFRLISRLMDEGARPSCSAITLQEQHEINHVAFTG
jgi:hypothetical protein